MVRFILMDIEGTTTSIDFVHQTLFPYAARHIRDFMLDHKAAPHISKEMEAVRTTVLEEENRRLNDTEVVDKLIEWIAQDRKHGALKNLQGYLWKYGYEAGEYKGHLYPDVLPELISWIESGLKLGIYSSGSVDAQKLLFGYSEAGDITPFLSAYFDTAVGHKREVSSYEHIAKALAIDPKNIMFLSDVEAELDAAKLAGFQTIQLVRPGTVAGKNHRTAEDFHEVSSIVAVLKV